MQQEHTTRDDRRTRQRELIRASILDSARQLLIEQGYEAFSMRKLAKTVGYSAGAIYLYFETKEALLHGLVEDAFDKLLEVLDEVHDDQDSVLSLRNKLHAYVDFGLSYPDHYYLAFVRRPTNRGVTQPTTPHAAFEVLRNAVARCVSESKLRISDVEVASQVLWAVIHGVTSLLNSLPGFPWVEHSELIDEVVETGIHGLVGSAADSNVQKEGRDE